MRGLTVEQRRQQQDEQHREVARSEGVRVARLRLSSNLNPYKLGDELYAEWFTAWQQENAAQAFRSAA